VKLFAALPALVAFLASGRALLTWWAWNDALRHHLGAGFALVLAALALAFALSALATARRLRAVPSGAARPGAALEWRLLLVLLVASCGAFTLLFPALQRPYAWAAWGLASGVLAAVCLRPAHGPLPTGWRALDVTLTSLAAGVLLLELLLRTPLPLLPSQLLVESSASAADRIAARRTFPGQVLMGFPCDSRGALDRELSASPAPARLVVSIADSFSLTAAPYPLHFTTVAERELPGTEIYNLGVAGISTPEYLHLLITEALPLQPDAVVVNLFLGNDLQLPPEPGRARLLEQFFDRETVYLTRTWQRLRKLSREVERRELPVTRLESIPATGPIDTVEEARAAFPWIADPLLEESAYSEEHFENLERKRALEACTETWADYPRIFGYLEDMLAAAGDVPLAFTLIPDEFQVEDSVWELVQSGTEVPLIRERPQQVLTAWFAERGIPVLDHLPSQRAQAPLADGDRHLYHLRDTHWNSRGHGVAGRELARFLREWLEPGD